MTKMTKKELAKVTRVRYRLASKSVKTFMLNEFCGNTEYPIENMPLSCLIISPKRIRAELAEEKSMVPGCLPM